MRYNLVSKSFLERKKKKKKKKEMTQEVEFSTVSRLVGPDFDTIFVRFNLNFAILKDFAPN
jgi:hypothetical protein